MATYLYYDLLDVAPDIPNEDINSAWSEAITANHPDNDGDYETYEKIVDAGHVLRNEEKRRVYNLLGHEEFIATYGVRGEKSELQQTHVMESVPVDQFEPISKKQQTTPENQLGSPDNGTSNTGKGGASVTGYETEGWGANLSEIDVASVTATDPATRSSSHDVPSPSSNQTQTHTSNSESSATSQTSSYHAPSSKTLSTSDELLILRWPLRIIFATTIAIPVWFILGSIAGSTGGFWGVVTVYVSVFLLYEQVIQRWTSEPDIGNNSLEETAPTTDSIGSLGTRDLLIGKFGAIAAISVALLYAATGQTTIGMTISFAVSSLFFISTFVMIGGILGGFLRIRMQSSLESIITTGGIGAVAGALIGAVAIGFQSISIADTTGTYPWIGAPINSVFDPYLMMNTILGVVVVAGLFICIPGLLVSGGREPRNLSRIGLQITPWVWEIAFALPAIMLCWLILSDTVVESVLPSMVTIPHVFSVTGWVELIVLTPPLVTAAFMIRFVIRRQ